VREFDRGPLVAVLEGLRHADPVSDGRSSIKDIAAAEVDVILSSPQSRFQAAWVKEVGRLPNLL
jgi:hypothetical protein